jgi:DNA-binding transcriptional LysR family regulator
LRTPNVEIVLTELITIEQGVALKEGRIDIGFGRLWFDDDGLTRRVVREEKLAIAAPHGHHLGRKRRRLTLQQVADVPLILYPNAPRPSYADQVLSFYRKRGLEPKVAFEVRELQTALGLVAAGLGISIVPLSVRRLGRDDVNYLPLDEPDIASPIIVSYRTNDSSALLARMLNLIEEFEQPSNVGARRSKA